MALTGSRVDTWLTHLQVDATFLGNWDQFSGGETDSEESLYRPGGYDESISLGGRQTIGNATLARYWDDWITSIYPWLRSRAGKARIYIARYPLTADFVQLGAPHGYQGTLKRVSPPDYDSMGNDAALIEVECTLDRAW
jgi:hypothetical protein